MLKIKDNVNLKELEKYGFEYRENYYIQYLYNTKTINARVEPSLHGETNKYFYISVNNAGEYTSFNNVLGYIEDYRKQLEKDIEEIKELFEDLIKADLVEKIEE